MDIQNEDRILIEGLAEGTVKIFDFVFLHYYSGLVAYAMKFGIDKSIAEDIVQEFFFKFWDNRQSINISGSLKNYLFTSIKNRCYDYFRREKVKENIQDTITLEEQDNSFADKDFLVEGELRERINTAIERLPDKCQKIFIMNRFEGLKPAEIAIAENISVRTVEGHIGKAIKLLRKDLKPYLPAFILAALLS